MSLCFRSTLGLEAGADAIVFIRVSKQLKKLFMKTKTNPWSYLSLGKKLFTLSLLTLFFVTGCNDDDSNSTPVPTKNIVQAAQGNSNLTSLVTALTKYPDLVATLSGTSKYTVFAPTNAAFANLLIAIGQTSLNDIPEDVLKKVLQYHVVSGEVKSTQLTTGNVATALGENIAVNVSSGVKLNTSTNVSTADVGATNGVVHIVDAVLVPPSILPIVGTIVAPAYFNKNFTTLIAAVNAASPTILTTLLNSTQKTLFAPTNAAFIAAGITTLPNRATLDAVLAYHVISGAEVKAANIATGSSAATTLGGKIYLSKGTAGVFINGTTQVTTTDIEGSNGVVHVINRTLIPPTKTIKAIAVEYSAASSPQFTQLVAALAKVPALLAAADAAGDLTVFAPTDAAFQALYTALGVANIDELEEAIGNDKLAQVLQHHIVGARVFSTDLVSGSVPTLNAEDNVTIDVTNLTITDANGSTPSTGLVPTLLNIHATNGVIHVINKVLIPTGIL